MSNPRANASVRFAYDLKARYALGRSVAALARELPLPLADWRRCGAEVLAALAGSAIEVGTGTTLRQLREALFAAPGREPEIAAIWSESLATAAFAAAYAQRRELDATAAAVAGLLHRAGEAAALRALALAESASGIRVDADARVQIVAQHSAAFLDALVRGWRLPPEVAVSARGWHHFGEFLTEGASTAVYLGHLLANELLRPQVHAPGMAEGVAADLQLTAQEFGQLREIAPVAQALIAALA